MKPYIATIGALVAGAALLTGCGGGDGSARPTPSPSAADFRARVDHPFFPLSSVGP